MDPEKRTIVSRLAQLDNDSRPPAPQPPVPTVITPFEGSYNDTNPQHILFCKMIGLPVNYETTPWPSIWNLRAKQTRKYKGLYARVRSAYQWHTFQYWLVATISNSLLWMQICFGAALTALGGTKSDRVSVSIIILGAIQTVFGGLITYFKSRNQPNRARQFRIGLKNVLDSIENSEALLRDPSYQPPPYMPLTINVGNTMLRTQEMTLAGAPGEVVTGVDAMVLRLMDMYLEACREAQANYPDFWLVNRHDQSQEQILIMRDMMQNMRRNAPAPDAGHGDDKAAVQTSTNIGGHFGAQTSRTDADAISRSGTTFSGHQVV